MDRSINRFVAAFGLTLVVILTAIAWSEHGYRFKNPWAQLRSGAPDALRNFPSTDLVASKLLYAVGRTRPFELAIFGNSRSVMLSTADIPGVDPRGFFNFSVGGTSFQQSVRSVEYLASHSVLPKTVIISYDNTELQFVGLATWPRPELEPHRLIADLAELLSNDYGTLHLRVRDAVKVADYFSDRSWRRFEQLWSLDTLFKRVQYFLGSPGMAGSGEAMRRTDGSRAQTLPDKRLSFASFKPKTSAHRADARYFLLGMKRLARVAQAHDVRIILYESPLAPELSTRLGPNPTAAAEETRSWIRLGCASTSLECHEAPVLAPSDSVYWPDCCHAPARLLGQYVAALLKRPDPA